MTIDSGPNLLDDDQRWRLRPDLIAARYIRGFERPSHIRFLGTEIASTISAGGGRLIINTPPQVGKSTLTSVATPIWLMQATGGRSRIILTSYEATVAEDWGRQVRNIIAEHGDELGIHLRGDSTSASRFHLTGGGQMITAGVGGSITGKPGDLILLDDPLKNYKDAHSPTVLRAQWNWYVSVVLSRIQPGTTIILVMTRWAEQDLSGLLGVQPGWRTIRLPALAEANDPLGRPIGEAIWPDRFNETHYEAVRVESGEYLFGGLYQQHPTPLLGDIFNDTKWEIADAVPTDLTMARYWDHAASDGKGDFTAGVLLGMDKANRVFVVDVINVRVDGTEVGDLMRRTAVSDLATYGCKTVRWEQEPGSAGKTLAKVYVRQLTGFDAAALPSTGDKVVRSIPFAAQQKAGNVSLCRTVDGTIPVWAASYREQLRLFPNGAFDDMVDASSGAYGVLLEKGAWRRPAGVTSSAGMQLGVRRGTYR